MSDCPECIWNPESKYYSLGAHKMIIKKEKQEKAQELREERKENARMRRKGPSIIERILRGKQ